ncbi:hypothetical protein DICSQDRAFT_131250 [Dichomitus squalens LYAD-421 SS1]|uniref:uncharacterized protein n=1 Tax=Dichomitus squalens (strain LYAD-421) TaxID=732165 RepID=UPI0004410DFF|nr:uncharacterized protein DICSQDRAFT_131250 [Dichomitus squalens LYAD-421 SS1]EJF66975.1 hypothetical protein DICSQDRAFT_131250 [Dichomitus squalens LYAD-421 SS1]
MQRRARQAILVDCLFLDIEILARPISHEPSHALAPPEQLQGPDELHSTNNVSQALWRYMKVEAALGEHRIANGAL